jgi:hypothetical protein
MDLREVGWGIMDLIDVSQVGTSGRVVNRVINLVFHRILGYSSVASQVAASQEWLNTMELVNHLYIYKFLFPS